MNRKPLVPRPELRTDWAVIGLSIHLVGLRSRLFSRAIGSGRNHGSKVDAHLVFWEPFDQLRRLTLCETVSEPGTPR